VAGFDITGLTIDVTTNDLTLTETTDESYTLIVEMPQASLTAKTVYGALRGLETLSQLVEFDMTSMSYLVNETMIVDSPRFQFRGVLIDTARHFVEVPVILQHLDAMAYNKMNVLHWHIVDDQSFPYESITYPELSLKGSWTGTPDHIYSQEQIQSIIQYAQYRGIRVIPEFDTPGHSLSWGNAYPQLLTACYDGQQQYGYGPINPLPQFTWDFLTGLYKELDAVFPDTYIHIGGDEVDFTCWSTNPQIQQWMQEHNYTNYAEVEQYYETKLIGVMESLNKSFIGWQEIFDNGLQLSPDTIIDVWKAPWDTELSSVTSNGFKAILSAPWYLNYISYGQDWPTYYAIEPLSFQGSQEQYDLVIGGEACMWAEFVDSTNLISRMWPRAGAIAERLWSPMNVTDQTDAAYRLQSQSCRLLRRQIDAEPPNGPSFCPQEFQSSYNPTWLNRELSHEQQI